MAPVLEAPSTEVEFRGSSLSPKGNGVISGIPEPPYGGDLTCNYALVMLKPGFPQKKELA